MAILQGTIHSPINLKYLSAVYKKNYSMPHSNEIVYLNVSIETNSIVSYWETFMTGFRELNLSFI